MGLAEARERLRRARLYLVVDAAAEHVLPAALRGGVDMVQLRDKELDDGSLLRAAERFRAACDEHRALFWVNDRPDLALAADADGVHVGQDDAPPAEVRELVEERLLIGLSTHSPDQFDAALGSEADQLSVGPIWETPTKEGRPGTGLDYVRYAAERGGDTPWFAIGGIDERNVGEVVRAGARRVVVVRAIRDAADPEAAARRLRDALAAGATTEGAKRRL
jgi:thiamine-phosphate pyrophosphorylase